MRANDDVRRAIREHGLTQWRVAINMGVSEQTFIRWLRIELPEDKKTAIIAAIGELSKEA